MVTGSQYSGIGYSEQVQGSSIFFLRGNVDTEPALVMPISAGLTLDSNTGIFFPIICSTSSSLETAGKDLVTRRIDSAKSQMNPRLLRTNIDGENVPNLKNYIRIAREYDVRSVESIRFKGLLSWFRSFFISPNFINHLNLS